MEIGGVALPAGVAVAPCIYLHAPPARPLPRPRRLPPRALPRAAGRHLHVDPVRRRRAALPGRELRAVRDDHRAARDRRAAALGWSRRRTRPSAPARRGDHARARARGARAWSVSAARRAATGRRRRPGRRRRRARCARAPAPPSAIWVAASRHDPLARAAGRSTWTVSSGLMNSQRSQSMTRRDAVAGVGDRQHALQRRRRLAGDDRDAQARPHGGRAGLAPGAAGEPHLDRGAVAEVARRRRRLGRARRRRAARRGRRRVTAAGSRQARAVITGCPPARSSASSSSTVRPGRATRAETSTSADRHRAAGSRR